MAKRSIGSIQRRPALSRPSPVAARPAPRPPTPKKAVITISAPRRVTLPQARPRIIPRVAARRVGGANRGTNLISKKPIMARPKGVIRGGALARAAIGSIPVVGAVASELFSQLTAQGVPPAQAARMAGKRTRRKGLTYREIKGAVKVLKLVKRFAPAGHHALRYRKSSR